MAFYVFEENAFDTLIESVEKKGKDLVIHQSPYESMDCYFPFPHHLLPDERDKQAVLTYMKCGDAVGYMHEILKVMLDGIYLQILELPIEPKPYPRNVTLVLRDGSVDTEKVFHDILLVSLKSQETYALDIAGAQHGCYNSVYPWDQYVESRVLDFAVAHPFGATQTYLLSSEVCSNLTNTGRVRMVDKRFAEILNCAVEIWQKDNLKLGEMLKLPEGEFHKLQGELILKISKALQSFSVIPIGKGDIELKR